MVVFVFIVLLIFMVGYIESKRKKDIHQNDGDSLFENSGKYEQPQSSLKMGNNVGTSSEMGAKSEEFIRKSSIVETQPCCDSYGRYKTLSDFTVIDIETTGLDRLSDGILSVSAVKYRHFRPVKEFNQLLNPHHEISEFITKLTGITKSDVIDKPYITDIRDSFMQFVGNDVLVGHNIDRFDIPFLCSFEFPLNNRMTIDTWLMAKSELNRSSFVNLKLETLKHAYGVKQKSHVSVSDCYTCGEVYLKMSIDRIQKLQVNNLNGYSILLLGEFYQRDLPGLKRDLRQCGAHISSKLTSKTGIIVTNSPKLLDSLGPVDNHVLIFKSLSDFYKAVNNDKIVKLNLSVRNKNINEYNDINFECWNSNLDLFERRLSVNMKNLTAQEQFMFKNFNNFFVLGDFAHDWLLFHKSLHDLVVYFERNHENLNQSQRKVAYTYLYKRCLTYLQRLVRYDYLYNNRNDYGNRAKKFIVMAFTEADSTIKVFDKNTADMRSLERIVDSGNSFKSYASHLTNNATSVF